MTAQPTVGVREAAGGFGLTGDISQQRAEVDFVRYGRRGCNGAGVSYDVVGSTVPDGLPESNEHNASIWNIQVP